MGLRTEEREVDGITITVTQFPARKALGMATRVAQAIAPALASGLDGNSGLALLFSGMDAAQTEALATDLLASTTARMGDKEVSFTNPANIDVVFNGNLAAMLKAVMFAAEVNFGGFFDGSLLGKAASTAPAGSG